MLDKTKALCAFLNASHSQYHARRYLTDILDSQGYTALREADEWTLTPGGKYYVTRGGSAVLAFRVPEGEALGFLISAAHTAAGPMAGPAPERSRAGAGADREGRRKQASGH